MAASVATRTARATTPDRVETDLAMLWRDVADETHAGRALMSNLVVFQERPEAEEFDLEEPLKNVPIVDVARHHPCRLIVLVHTPAVHEHRTPLDTAVSILTFTGGDSRHAVEQIAVRSSCAEASLPSLVGRFILGDLPTSVWWTDDLSQVPPLTALATFGRQFVYDSARWQDVRAGFSTLLALLDGRHAPVLADLNWRRLAPVRSAVRLGTRDLTAVPRRLRVHVTHAQQNEALARLLVGWLSSTIHRGSEIAAAAEQGADDMLTLSVEEDSRLRYKVTREGDDVFLTGPTLMASQFVVPRESAAEAVASELQSLGRDSDLVESIRAATRMTFERGDQE